jgi:hypothetical protein
MKTRLGLLLLAFVLIAAAVPDAFGAKAVGGALGLGKSLHREKSRGDELACTWYSITCNNGTTDSCCGDVYSCGSYCQSVCGGPCTYSGDAD